MVVDTGELRAVVGCLDERAWGWDSALGSSGLWGEAWLTYRAGPGKAQEIWISEWGGCEWWGVWL